MPKIVVITRQAMPYVPGDRPSLPDTQAAAMVRTGFARELTEDELKAHVAPEPVEKRSGQNART